MITLPTTTSKRISAAGIVIRPVQAPCVEPRPAYVKTDEERAARNQFFKELRLLKAKSGPNRDHQAYVLIVACIEYGMNTQRRLVAALGRLDFNQHHVENILGRHAGDDPAIHAWRRDYQGYYRLNS